MFKAPKEKTNCMVKHFRGTIYINTGHANYTLN